MRRTGRRSASRSTRGRARSRRRARAPPRAAPGAARSRSSRTRPGRRSSARHVTVSVGGVTLTRQTDGTGGELRPGHEAVGGRHRCGRTSRPRRPRRGAHRGDDGRLRHRRARQGVRREGSRDAGRGAEPDWERGLPPLRDDRLHRHAGRPDRRADPGRALDARSRTTSRRPANMSYQADYQGDANYPAATGACEPLTVTPAPAPRIAIVKNPQTQIDRRRAARRGSHHGHQRREHRADERDRHRSRPRRDAIAIRR